MVRTTGLRQKRESHARDTDVGASNRLMLMETMGMHESSQGRRGATLCMRRQPSTEFRITTGLREMRLEMSPRREGRRCTSHGAVEAEGGHHSKCCREGSQHKDRKFATDLATVTAVLAMAVAL